MKRKKRVIYRTMKISQEKTEFIWEWMEKTAAALFELYFLCKITKTFAIKQRFFFLSLISSFSSAVLCFNRDFRLIECSFFPLKLMRSRLQLIKLLVERKKGYKLRNLFEIYSRERKNEKNSIWKSANFLIPHFSV